MAAVNAARCRQATTRGELTELRAVTRGRVGVVMTMGALHDGHATLLREARSRCDTVIATIFVNPLQFGVGEDLARYPRSLEADLAICADSGVDIVFTPDERQMYPSGAPAVTVDPGPLGGVLEGASRPGHFAGVLTVVAKLSHLTRPDVAFFGEKDYQQLTLIRQMAADLDLGIEVVGIPIVREADGLAMSSRNAYLSSPQRVAALALSASLYAGAAHAAGGPRDVTAAALAEFARLREGCEDILGLDYLVLTDAALAPDPSAGTARLLIAATVGNTRLIDNIGLHLG
ncbi:MAG TPA: pantoate--beta-alanine ligase [Mycobacteriales bacterium]|jgi:pantoate--beta-alanine ligase|nr:pantoate--beta-alanine ligase [Mycobacteriales bacterium]